MFAFLLSLVLPGCDIKTEIEGDCPDNGLIQAVLVRKGCEAYVFRLIQYSPDAQPNWVDIFTNTQYHNVISVLNYCGTDQDSKDLQGLNQGEYVGFELRPTSDHCAIMCLAWEDAPTHTFNASKITRCAR